MAEAHVDDEIFVYTGGDQEVPDDVRRVRIDKSVKIIPSHAFAFRRHLIDVDFHNGIERIERLAFIGCQLLKKGLETIQDSAFERCHRLRRIALPFNCMIGVNVFQGCPKLATVDLVGGIHNTIASLHLESWRNQMKDKINRINQVLPTIGAGKSAAVQQWMGSVTRRLSRYKAGHKALLKEATTLLELALWKANLDDNEGGVLEREGVRTTRGRRKRARREICVTSGASIVIKNVLPFLQLE